MGLASTPLSKMVVFDASSTRRLLTDYPRPRPPTPTKVTQQEILGLQNGRIESVRFLHSILPDMPHTRTTGDVHVR